MSVRQHGDHQIWKHRDTRWRADHYRRLLLRTKMWFARPKNRRLRTTSRAVARDSDVCGVAMSIFLLSAVQISNNGVLISFRKQRIVPRRQRPRTKFLERAQATFVQIWGRGWLAGDYSSSSMIKSELLMVLVRDNTEVQACASSFYITTRVFLPEKSIERVWGGGSEARVEISNLWFPAKQ